ncbi:MAG: sugar phosphate nucleotidyltransferase [Candidatus Diapherotrites archaeon]|nr:NTP transferase domain-containing protein [Candidatus Micrarchaeota archaeon]MBU1940048.1 NTP transferase domain-containing protein [Candidatus Micrarchaeota archaeon]
MAAKQKIEDAVILAGGLNSRALPAAKAVPKTMLPLGMKPALQLLVEECRASGIKRIVVVAANRRAAEIMRYHFTPSPELNSALKKRGKRKLLEELSRLETLCKFEFVSERTSLGEAHALLSARRALKGRPFAVLYGDTLFRSRVPALRQAIAQFRGRHVFSYARFVFKPEIFRTLRALNYRALYNKKENKGVSLPALAEQFLLENEFTHFRARASAFNIGDAKSYKKAFNEFA